MKPEKLDAKPILEVLARIRKSLPPFDPNVRRPSEDSRTRIADGFDVKTAEDFEWAAAIDGIQSLAADVRTMVDQKSAEALESGLKIYYAAEELARDPEHADLIPHVERMREAYQRDFGRPIPPKGEGGGA